MAKHKKDSVRHAAEKSLGRPLDIESNNGYDNGYLDGFRASVSDGTPDGTEFSDWYSKLLFSSVQYPASNHPLGACILRDVVRDKTVKEAMRSAFNRIILEEEDVHSQP